MPRLNFEVDEATILKTYKIGSLNPTQWEEVDDDNLDDPVLLDASREKERENGDPLGLLVENIDIKDIDTELKSHISISSKHFSPSTYLSVVHPQATYTDLLHGISYLEDSLAEGSGALRILVEDHFDRFVSVKSITDGLHEDMKQGILAPEKDHGSLPLRINLKDGFQKANQIFLPVVETASKAQKLRTTMSVFERSKFFFNLPSFIIESIDAGRYDLALRDYKKGKYLLENRPSQLLPIASNNSSNTSKSLPIPPEVIASQQAQQKRILQKVWLSVEKAMAELKSVVVKQLVNPARTVDEVEKSLETLLELQTSDEPLWTYFDHRHQYIKDEMNSALHRGIKNIQAVSQNVQDITSSIGPLETVLRNELKISVSQLEGNQSETVLANSSVEPVWTALLDLVRSISEIISSTLPSFWTIGKGFIDGKYKKLSTATATSTTRRGASQCRTMATEIIQLYISLISQIFILSDITLMSSPSASASFQQQQMASEGDHFGVLHLLPKSSPSLCTAYYAQKILNEVGDCATDLAALDLTPARVPQPGGGGNGAAQALKSLMESLRWRMLDLLTADWLKDAGLFYILETWIVSRTEPSSTVYLARFELFQRYMTTAAYKIACGPSNTSSSITISKSKNGPTQISTIFTNKITRSFIDALYAFLDGMVLLTSEESPILQLDATSSTYGATDVGNLDKDSLAFNPMEMRLHELLDLRDGNVRLLLVISNLDYLSTAIIPGMIAQLEGAFGFPLTDDRNTIKSVLKELDQTLFNGYINPRAAFLIQKMRDGATSQHTDWLKTPLPTSIRPYVSEIMNYLVEVHSQVCDVASGLLDRAMNPLLDQLVNTAVETFGEIKRFGTGGLLLAVLELTFIHKALGYYGRDTVAGKSLEDLYTHKITTLYSPSSNDPDFKTSFDAMQKTLADARRASAVQFLCFRQNSNTRETTKVNGDSLLVIKGSKERDKSDKESFVSTSSSRKVKNNR